MSLCINPKCSKPFDPLNVNNNICRNCGTGLLLASRYRVKNILSVNSGFANVYEVDDRGTLRILKVLKEHLNTELKVVESFRKEAEVLNQLRHPGIPRVESDGYFTILPRNSQQPIHCLVMEKIEGINLEQWMEDNHNQPISEKQALEWLTQITQILEQVHQQDYFHRDIKPPNIMRRLNGQLVLIDFGTAREITDTYLVKVSGAKSVTRFISPGFTPLEQVNGKAVPQSDFFSLGRTFVYLLTAQLPCNLSEDPLTGKLIWQHAAPQISRTLVDLIDDMMGPFPGNRPQTTQIILQRLQEIERDLYTPQPLPPHSVPPKSTVASPQGVNLTLKTAMMDYTRLRDLLAAKKWLEADRETTRVMLKVGKETESWANKESIKKFPYDDIHIIDKLWVDSSNGHFGFSIQKNIWLTYCGGVEGKHNYNAIMRLGNLVGWRQKTGFWKEYPSEYIFRLNTPLFGIFLMRSNAPKGHLPTWEGMRQEFPWSERLFLIGGGWECFGVLLWDLDM
jgi:serine/threonine protein kinase